jgi:uncharacterized protein YeaO (DUF488 family)
MSGFRTFRRAPNSCGRHRELTRAAFRRKFQREMSEPDRRRELDVLAALSHQTNLSLGCYWEDESSCHRSVLRELLTDLGAEVV